MMKLFYFFKPIIPRSVQIFLRRIIVKKQRNKFKDVWPILRSSSKKPDGWIGWPGSKKFAFVLTHDVEQLSGHDKCMELMKIEEKLGFRSLYNFVPERYQVSAQLRESLTNNGFEVGVHGLNHDGKLFQTREIFDERAKKINYYLNKWEAVGFRAPAMHHNLEWIKELNIEYDLSTFDTDPFEPQSDGVGTIFPFCVKGQDQNHSYVELPYTLVQDFTCFVLMKEKTIDIWKRKIDWIAKEGGMALVNVHPDYVCFNGKPGSEEFVVDLYINFLKYVREKFSNQYYNVLPKKLAEFWLQKNN